MGRLLTLSEPHLLSVLSEVPSLTSFDHINSDLGPKPRGTTVWLGGPGQIPAPLRVSVSPSVTRCFMTDHILLTALLFFLLWLSLDRDECLLGAHDCSRRQFCVNTLGSFYCVNHTVFCAQGFILNVHRKCVGKREPLLPPPSWRSALLHTKPATLQPHAKGPACPLHVSSHYSQHPMLCVTSYMSWCPVLLLH